VRKQVAERDLAGVGSFPGRRDDLHNAPEGGGAAASAKKAAELMDKKMEMEMKKMGTDMKNIGRDMQKMGMEIVRMDDGEEFFLPEKESRIQKNGDNKYS
jgi:hypothetical protein